MIVPATDLPDRRHRTSLLICVIFVIVFPTLATTDAGKHEYGNTYEKKTEDNREFSENTKQSKHADENSKMKRTENHGRVSDENGSTLNKFLENVLKAQDDLKWIDHIVRNTHRTKNWDKSPTGSNKNLEHQNFDATSSGGKVRDKRSFLWRTNQKKYSDLYPPEPPQRVYIDSDMSVEKNLDPDNADTFQNGMNEKENGKDVTDDQLPKEWSNTKDICSLNDWLNSNKNFKGEQDKRGDRWMHDYESDQGNQLNPLKTDPRVNARYQRDEAKKAESPSLESLKETILELKKSLNEDEKREHQARVKEKEDVKERNTRAKNKHEKHGKDTESWWDSSEPEVADLKKREQDPDDFSDKNVHPNAWRKKRTEANNDDDSRKFFHRAGFGESYLEEEALKALHDRKRRSKGTPTDEKHQSNESCDDKNNLLTDEKDSLKTSKEIDCHDLDDLNKKESNDLQTNYAIEQGSKPTNNFPDTSSSVFNGRGSGVAENCEQGNRMENKLTKNEGKDSLRMFRSKPNELQSVSDQTSTLDKDDKEEEAKTQRDKAFEFADRPYPNNDGINTGQRTEESDENHGKLLPEKRSPQESGNINILLKSEKKDLIKFSNGGPNENSGIKGERQPYVFNRFDIRKKMYMENEEKPGKSVATVYNVKIEKAQVDAPVKDKSKREGSEREKQSPFSSLNFGKDKADEFDENKHGLMSDMNERNVDEGRIENSVEINKGSTERSEGTQNWYKNHNQFSTIYKNSAEKDQLENKEENLNDKKIKEASVRDSNDKINDASNLADKSTEHEEKNKRKYTQIVIVPDGLDDRKLSDMYGQRRILQYMEYSDDDIEDADASYSDKEEESQRQDIAEKSDAPSKRRERSAVSQKERAKVNVLIKQKLDKKKQNLRGTMRKRRNPVSVIEYYDYDSDNEQPEHETDEQERIKTSYDKNPIESDLVLADTEVKHTLIPPATKKDEHEAEMRKQEKLNKKLPKQQFIVSGTESRPKNVTEKMEEGLARYSTEGSSLVSQQIQSGRLNQGEDNVNAISRGRLNQPISEREDKFLEGGSKDSATYVFNKDQQSNPDMIDEFLEDIQSMDEKNDKVSNNFEPLYEELKKIYDWNQDDSHSKPRIKGDHRMYYGANDKLDPTNKMSESYTGQIELPETQASSPNLLPLLLVYDGSGRAIGAKTDSSDYPECASTCNVSGSNYLALKRTDDMFKGGSEQSNNTEQKLREPGSIGTAVEWREQKVSGVSNDAPPEKDARSWSLTGRRQYIDTDSRSPYENRKYLESWLPRERVQNIDREKQTVISSGDLHESFVEPSDWIDDFDEDMRPRLSRSLKTIDQKNPESSTNKMAQDGPVTKVKDGVKGTSTLITERNLLNVSTEISKVQDSTMKTMSTVEDSRLSLRYPSLDLRDLFNKPNDRVKRQIQLPYDTYYDDKQSPDSEKLDYYEYSKNQDETNDRVSEPNEEIAIEDENDGKVARGASSKKKKQHRKRKHRHSDEKKGKKKSHAKKSKYSGNSNRRRRHPKKHSNDLKTKHEHDHKKHKKRVPKTGNLKKSNVDDKVHGIKEFSVNERKTRRNKMDSEHAMNIDSEAQRKISSLLSIDNVEDESQMGSALHGELAGKIVDHIFEQVQKNEDLKLSLGPGLYQKHKTGETVSANKAYRQALDDDEMNHATELLNKIMLLLNRLIFDEVQRKTCVSLSPDLTEFLDWILDVNPRRNSMEQPASLPVVHAMDVPHHFPKDKFLFRDSTSNEMGDEFNELRRKLQLVEKLINEYRTLSEKEKTKVQSVHDYLSNQLDRLLEFVQAIEKEKLEFPTKAAKGKSGMILQYQGGMTNTSNGGHSMRPNMASPSPNVSNSLKAKNERLLADEDFYEDGLDSFRKRRRTIRSLDKQSKPRKKHRKRGKRKKKHRKRHKGGNAIDQLPHKDTVHNAMTSRQKREYLDKEFRDSFESEYEEPLIYSSMDFENVESKSRDDRTKGSLKDEDDKKIFGSNDEVKKKEIQKRIDSFDTSSGKSNLVHGELDSNTKSKIIDEKHRTDAQLEEEPITGKDQLEDEILLLNKRQSWKRQNEEQLEELAFGEDMRKGLKEKELFEKLTGIDKEISSSRQ
ncbi:uncharacterized protein LOC105662754 isoform X3 [Megachile rotundata]|uniref:uncharacterized protein LOC105662754 isoform X3 n=1 Tax=Megachile rotundata TaxID=143995 RepID=UPI003FD13603